MCHTSHSCIENWLVLIPFHIHQSKTNKQSLATHLSSSSYLGSAVRSCIKHRTEQMHPSVLFLLSHKHTQILFCLKYWSVTALVQNTDLVERVEEGMGEEETEDAVLTLGCQFYRDAPLLKRLNSMTAPQNFSPKKMLPQNSFD